MIAVLPAESIRAWDQYTITHEPISSRNLMERAALRCTQWIQSRWHTSTPMVIFCGKGNNGGDGLAIARNLLESGYRVSVYATAESERSADNLHQYQLLQSLFSPCLQPIESEWKIEPNAVLIDALFGTGLRQPLQYKEKSWVEKINRLAQITVSIDIPSGLPADHFLPDSTAVQANFTLSFQCYKKCFLFPETGAVAGLVSILDIGLHPDFLKENPAMDYMIDADMARNLYRPRPLFSHKGTFGHALLFTGSKGKMGASVLAARACLRSGAGLLSVLTPESENAILQTALPEAMTIPYQEKSLLPRLDMYQSIGAGCGLGQGKENTERLIQLLSESSIPLILDADALNIVAQQPELLPVIPEGSLLTPHPIEFDRLFGVHANTIERYETQRKKAAELRIYILLKGHHTCICTPQGTSYFTLLGNPGMAKGGSGDVLTGILCGLQAQYRNILTAGILGTYLHGLAGDLAAHQQSQESMLASDIIEQLPLAFRSLSERDS